MQVSLDRFEGETGVLLTRDGQVWLVPRGCLPDGTVEGDILAISFLRDVHATGEQSERIRRLQEKLLDRTRERSGQD